MNRFSFPQSCFKLYFLTLLRTNRDETITRRFSLCTLRLFTFFFSFFAFSSSAVCFTFQDQRFVWNFHFFSPAGDSSPMSHPLASHYEAQTNRERRNLIFASRVKLCNRSESSMILPNRPCVTRFSGSVIELVRAILHILDHVEGCNMESRI